MKTKTFKASGSGQSTLFRWPMKPVRTLCCVVFACCFLLQSAASDGMGLPEGWEKAVVLVEVKCADLPSVPCSAIPSLPNGEPGPLMPDGKSGCANFCIKPTGSCPVQFLDICKSPTGYAPIATGFIMQICGVTVLVSNRHVLAEAEGRKQLFVRARLKSGEQMRFLVGEMHGHPNKDVDIAVAQLQYDETQIKSDDIVVGVIPEDVYKQQGKTCLASLATIRAGDQAVFAGFPLVIRGVRGLVANQETPLVRSGIVSMVLPGDNKIGERTFHDIFLMDSWAFQGNSGSPVVIPPSPIGYQNDQRERNSAHLVGVVSAFFDLDAPIEQAVIVGGVKAKVNSGLAIVQSIEGIELLVQQIKGAKCNTIPGSGPEQTTQPKAETPVKNGP